MTDQRFRGVSPHRDGGFVASIGFEGKGRYLGIFREFEAARTARLNAELTLFGCAFDRREIEIEHDIARIPLHGRRGQFYGWAIIDVDDLDRVKHIAWTMDSRGYVVGRPPGSRSSITLHQFLFPSSLGDHEDRDRLNNRRGNIRRATSAQNARNSSLSRNNSSGIKGVRRTRSGSWQARITVDRREIHLGNFSCADDAARAYELAARRLHGEFASPVSITGAVAPSISL